MCSVVLGTIAEGCIGETVAALEVAEALAHCEEAKVREVLERISIEESRHAELAWQFVAWALATCPKAQPSIRRSATIRNSLSRRSSGHVYRAMRSSVACTELRSSAAAHARPAWR